MVYRAAAATCPGKKKSYNSNNFYLNSKYITEEYCSSQILLTQKKDQKGLQIYAVSEGYGADLYQDEASLIAVKNLFKYHSKKVDELTSMRQTGQSTANVDLAAFVSAYIQSTNNAVKARVNAVGEKARNLQSTLALVCIKGRKIVTANLGDTRIAQASSDRSPRIIPRPRRWSILTSLHLNALPPIRSATNLRSISAYIILKIRSLLRFLK